MAQNTVRPPTEAERHQVQQIVSRHEADRPDGVCRVEVEFGEDWTGYPAAYIHLFVDKTLEPTADKIDELNRFVKVLHDEIIDAGVSFWPYSRTSLEE